LLRVAVVAVETTLTLDNVPATVVLVVVEMVVDLLL
jgi:hypothetical protein